MKVILVEEKLDRREVLVCQNGMFLKSGTQQVPKMVKIDTWFWARTVRGWLP